MNLFDIPLSNLTIKVYIPKNVKKKNLKKKNLKKKNFKKKVI
jgi:hypothetical protein